MKTVASAFCCLLLASLAGCASAPPPDAPAVERPQGWSDRSYYLPMRDGVRLAVSLYFPDGAPPRARAPTILIQTRYGRASEAMRLDEAASAETWRADGESDVDRWRGRGYVVAVADVRGSTSSYGLRRFEIGPDERADMDELIAHFASQPWSDGRVIAYGFSYMADTADVATSRPAPALVAAIPRETDFDVYLHVFFPGGLRNDFMLNAWGGFTREIDEGRSGQDDGTDCQRRVEDCRALFPLLQPVDDDHDLSQLRTALHNRDRWSPEDFADAEFRDDLGANGYRMFDSSPAAYLDGIRREAKPVQYWGSWLDGGTAEAALARFRSAPEAPMEVWITANNHGHNIGADPFFPDRRAPAPSRDAQFNSVADFSDRVLRGEEIGREINYYVMGAGEFRRTRVWPPEGVRETQFFLAANNALAARSPAYGRVDYAVDFTAETGANTRWSTQFGPPPAYPDRREADRKLIVFDSSPMTQDMELSGAPIVDLYLAARSRDPAVIAYLEDVAPDGRVTYLAEGMLRAVNRAPADPADLPYDQGEAAHTYARADALPVTPGEVMRLRFALFPTAALVRRGHRLRLAIAGADAAVFRRYSEGGEDVFTIGYGGAEASALIVPMRPWR